MTAPAGDAATGSAAAGPAATGDAATGAAATGPAATDATPVLSCSGLVRTFGALRAVDGVELALPTGARHALIGPNGAGKSTLFQLLAGGLRPTAGRVWLDGRDVTRLSDARRARRGIGQTFQHSSLFLSMTAAENVALAAERVLGAPWSPLPRRKRALDERVHQLLADVDLDARRDVPVAALSHGECRQLELAVALATEPRVLLLDEPAAGLSPAESERLAALIHALPAAITLLFVEHDLDLVFRLATRVTVLHLGKVLVSGSPEEVRGSAEVQEAYLGTGRREDLFLPGAPATATAPTTGTASAPTASAPIADAATGANTDPATGADPTTTADPAPAADPATTADPRTAAITEPS